MGFNNDRLIATDIPAIDAPLTYAIDRPWGLLAVTSEAHETYGLEPKIDVAEPDQTFAQLVDEADSHTANPASPNVHLLVATPDELGQQVMPGYTRAHSVYRPRSLQVTVASGSGLAMAQEDVAMDLTLLANARGFEDADELRIGNPDGDTIPVSELRRFFAQQQTVLSMARAAGSTITTAAPDWLRNDYNARLVRGVRNAGLLTAGAIAGVDALTIAANHGREALTFSPLFLAAVCGLTAYSAIRRQAEGANDREHRWREASRYLATIVVQDLVHIYRPLPPQATSDTAS